MTISLGLAVSGAVKKKMGEEGLEPPTSYLEGSCSIRLSYSP